MSSASPYEPSIGFSRAVRVGNLIAVSGTAPIGPDHRTLGPGDPVAQTRRCFEIIQAALADAGASLADVRGNAHGLHGTPGVGHTACPAPTDSRSCLLSLLSLRQS